MRSVIVLALVIGCSNPSEGPDPAPADAPADVPTVDRFDRRVNQILVAGDFIFWSHGRFSCSLEDPCPLEGPAVTSWWRVNNSTATRYEGGVGARSADDEVGYAFAVLPDKLLVEFTAKGFREIPR